MRADWLRDPKGCGLLHGDLGSLPNGTTRRTLHSREGIHSGGLFAVGNSISTVWTLATATPIPTPTTTTTITATAANVDNVRGTTAEAAAEIENTPKAATQAAAPANPANTQAHLPVSSHVGGSSENGSRPTSSAAAHRHPPHTLSYGTMRTHDPGMTDEVDLDAGELGSDPSTLLYSVETGVQTDQDEGAMHAEAQTDARDCELPREESIMRIFRALRALTRQQLPTQADFLLPSATQFSAHAAEQMRHDCQADVKSLHSLTAAEATWRLRRALLYVGAANAMRNRLVREIALVPAWQSSTSRMFVRCLDLVLQSAHILLNPAAAGPRPSDSFGEVAKAVGMEEEGEEERGWDGGDGEEGFEERRVPLRTSALPAVEALTGSPRGLIKVPTKHAPYMTPPL